jgi:hypothetical protein
LQTFCIHRSTPSWLSRYLLRIPLSFMRVFLYVMNLFSLEAIMILFLWKSNVLLNDEIYNIIYIYI